MKENPIEKLMSSVMTNLKDMIDVNTIVGKPIIAGNITVIPVSKVIFGFGSGGSEFNTETLDEYANTNGDEEILYKLPFGGGSGAGVSIKPIAFLIVDEQANVKVVHLDNTTSLDKVLENVPEFIDKISTIISDNSKKNDNSEYIKAKYIKM